MLLGHHYNPNRLIFKIILLIISFLFFGILYYLICKDTDFGGINRIQEEIRDKIINKLTTNIVDGKQNINKIKKIDNLKSGDITSELKDILEETKLIDKKNITKLDNDLKYNIEKGSNQKLFDFIYFSIATGTTLGYGDIYPISNKSKIITIMQLLTTVFIILF